MVCDGTELLMHVHDPSMKASKSESEVGVQSHQEMCPRAKEYLGVHAPKTSEIHELGGKVNPAKCKKLR